MSRYPEGDEEETKESLNLERVDATTILDEDDLRDVISTVADITLRWQDLGVSLGIRQSELENILSDRSHSPVNCLKLMLTQWLRQNYNVERFGEPTWRRLVEAVGDHMGGNNVVLAQTIAREHLAPTLIELTTTFQGREERPVNIPKAIGTNYIRFGARLLNDPTGQKLNELFLDHMDDAERNSKTVLQEWIAGRGKHPVTWKTLTEVLQDINLDSLAEEIEAVKLSQSKGKDVSTDPITSSVGSATGPTAVCVLDRS